MLQKFFLKLKESIEDHSIHLKGGKLLLPEYLEGRRFSSSFSPIIRSVATGLRLKLKTEFRNYMPNPKDYDCGKWQQVDFVLKDKDKPIFFLELESLDRAQQSTFSDKLWYYYGSLANHLTFGKVVPAYFVWLLILPDEPVQTYSIWDSQKEYNFFPPSRNKKIFKNPYRFYDHRIKRDVRSFLLKNQEFQDPVIKNWIPLKLTLFQNVCELVFITCTRKRLILSRGKDCFDPKKETMAEIKWVSQK